MIFLVATGTQTLRESYILLIILIASITITVISTVNMLIITINWQTTNGILTDEEKHYPQINLMTLLMRWLCTTAGFALGLLLSPILFVGIKVYEHLTKRAYLCGLEQMDKDMDERVRALENSYSARVQEFCQAAERTAEVMRSSEAASLFLDYAEDLIKEVIKKGAEPQLVLSRDAVILPHRRFDFKKENLESLHTDLELAAVGKLIYDMARESYPKYDLDFDLTEDFDIIISLMPKEQSSAEATGREEVKEV